MERWRLLLAYDNAVEQVKLSNAKLHTIRTTYTDPETILGHTRLWEQQRDTSAEAAIDALRGMLA